MNNQQDRNSDSGLYEKYEVYEDGERVTDCFVLEPDDDPATREALLRYAEETEDEDLAKSLREWVNEAEKETPSL